MTVVLHSYPVWLPLTQIWMHNQIRYLPDDVEPHVLCDRTENPSEFGLVNTHCLGERPTWYRLWNKGLRVARLHGRFGFAADAVAAYRPAVLHSHFGHVGWSDMPIARRAGIAHVVTFYGLDVNFLPLRYRRWRRRFDALFGHADLILCEGAHMAECLVSLGCERSKVRVQHLGVGLEDIAFKPVAWQAGTPLRVLIAASFREKKGIPLALAALARLRHDVALEITLIGDAGPEPRSQAEKGRILDSIERHRLGGSVRRLGYVSHAQLLEEARNHHIFLSPSLTAEDGDTEGGAPVSLIDMAASGLLVVSSNHCDIPEIIEDGRTGFLAAEGNLDNLEATLRRALDGAERWDQLRRAARAHVEATFDARRQSERLAELYRFLAGSR